MVYVMWTTEKTPAQRWRELALMACRTLPRRTLFKGCAICLLLHLRVACALVLLLFFLFFQTLLFFLLF